MDETQVIDRLASLLVRNNDAHKYNFGHALIIGGSKGMGGSVVLSGLAALRSGAGLITIASEVAESLQAKVPEIMTLSFDPSKIDESMTILNKLIIDRHVSQLVIGPGLSESAYPFIKKFSSQVKLPLVLDGGGLTAFSSSLNELKTTAENTDLVLTPHNGEFEKLSGQKLPKDSDTRLMQAQEFAKEYKLTLVLKGHRTAVLSKDGQVYVNQTGNPGMATAGSGEVLSGMISALSGQEFDSFTAASCAVYLHGLAGDLAIKTKSQPGLIASDLINALPEAWLTLLSK